MQRMSRFSAYAENLLTSGHTTAADYHPKDRCGQGVEAWRRLIAGAYIETFTWFLPVFFTS
jgi:hypothetical protein